MYIFFDLRRTNKLLPKLNKMYNERHMKKSKLINEKDVTSGRYYQNTGKFEDNRKKTRH